MDEENKEEYEILYPDDKLHSGLLEDDQKGG